MYESKNPLVVLSGRNLINFSIDGGLIVNGRLQLTVTGLTEGRLRVQIDEPKETAIRHRYRIVLF